MSHTSVSVTDYSRIADYYDKVRPLPADMWISKMIEHGEIRENGWVLDIGCGTGRYPLSISASTKALFCCLEISLAMLKKAVSKDKSRKILWVQGDGQKLPFRDNFFDSVYMTLVIHHIEDKKTVLGEIYRTLKKGGNCVIMTTSHYRIRRHILHLFPRVVSIDLKRFPSIPYLKSAMAKTGFGNIHHHALKYIEDTTSTNEYFKRVRKKYISTLTLLTEEEFEKGIKVFKKKVREKYGKQITRIIGFDFVIGKKL